MKKLFAAGLLALAPTLSQASDLPSVWSVDDATSALFYVTTKKEHVAERHTISGVTGALSEEGVLRVELDMDSLKSGVEVRDGRLKEHLFKVDTFPTTVFTAEIDLSEYESLAVGESVEGYIEGDLLLAGVEGFVDFSVMVTRAGDNRVVVSSFGPIIVDSADFELSEGVDTLREIAKLPHISYMVPVTFTVAFTRG